MPKSDRPWAPTQSYLLPPSPLEWLPKDHLAYFVLDLVSQLDLSAIEGRIAEKDPRGERPYAPAMMLGLLLYGYATGVYSSRRISRATYEDIAFRVLAGNGHPFFTTINEFRLQYLVGHQAVEATTTLLADSGYMSEANVRHAEQRDIDVLIAVGRRQPKHSTPAWMAMRDKLARPDAHAAYARRKVIAEPPFGQIQDARGFRRFSMRGLAKSGFEWAFVCLAHNALKLFRALAKPLQPEPGRGLSALLGENETAGAPGRA